MVVLPADADAQAEDQAATGHPVHGGGLLGNEGGVAQWGEQHFGVLNANAGSGAREEGEGDQGLGIVVDEPVEQAQGAEGSCVGALGPGEQGFRGADGRPIPTFMKETSEGKGRQRLC